MLARSGNSLSWSNNDLAVFGFCSAFSFTILTFFFFYILDICMNSFLFPLHVLTLLNGCMQVAL